MSLFENNAARRKVNQQKNNQGNNKQRNNNGNNKHNSGKNWKEQTQGKENAITRRFNGNNDNSNIEYESVTVERGTVEEVNAVLSSFVSEMKKNIASPAEIRSIIEDRFEDVVSAMACYYDPKYEDCLSHMNAVLDIMSTNQFAAILLRVLNDNVFESWDDIWRDAALLFSILLNTSCDKMKEGTIQIYVNDILASQGMFRTELDQLTERYGITEELAIDMIIGLPVNAANMTDLLMRSTYEMFLTAMLNNADDNVAILGAECQRGLLEFFFSEDNNRHGKLMSKVIGRYLASPDMINDLSAPQALVYGEFKEMLYNVLDSYDVKNIAFVVKYIAEQKRRTGKDVMFDVSKASNYNTIRKAIVQVIAENPELQEYLV